MTELRVESLRMPATDLGEENPLPRFRDPQENKNVRVDPAVPEEDRKYFGWQSGFRVMPHRLQDAYSPELKPTDFEVAVLENEHLRATVLPSMGGRLLSLYSKDRGRELLEHNPILRLGNLALRNAWFSGGVEWNTGQPGHSYSTCAPVFAARIEGSKGEPALRIYEWDRVKRFPWQLEMHLPPDSPFLYVRVRLVNPHDHEIPMYWWTNIAVPETPRTRALAPATEAIRFDLELGLTMVDFAGSSDVDHSYATRIAGSKDIFFRVPPEQWPWLAALDGEGKGLFQTSTPRLRGRKLFAWGNHQGGRRWQEFLGGPGKAYIEVQAGLTRTQTETVPMPAQAEWTWTEVFGLLEAPADEVHQEDWDSAWHATQDALSAIISPESIDEADAALAPCSLKPAREILFLGSGWAALERRRLAAEGKTPRLPDELAFDSDSLGEAQRPWLELLENGALPETEPDGIPGHWMIQEEWAARIEEGLARGKGDHWLSWLHLGNARMEAFDAQGAREAWQKSRDCRNNAWALRNLAVLAGRDGDDADARKLLDAAWKAGPKNAALAVECARSLRDAGEHSALRDFIAELPEELRHNERLVVMDAWAALEVGDFATVEAALQREFAYVREGFSPLTDLWFELHARRIARNEAVDLDEALRERVRAEFPAPKAIDFRQKA